MSRYSVNEEELRKGQQLLLHVGNKLEAAARNVENAKESLMGYTGYGIERQRYTLETQKNVLALQMENVERLRACIQQVMERTQAANQEARAELQNLELNTGFKTAADIIAAEQAKKELEEKKKREAEERKRREEEERKKAQEQANRNPGNAGGSQGSAGNGAVTGTRATTYYAYGKNSWIDSGCATYSMAMILANMGVTVNGNIVTPENVRDKYGLNLQNRGIGFDQTVAYSSCPIADRSKEEKVAAVRDALRENPQGVILGFKTYYADSANNAIQHFVVATGVDGEGNIIVNDPYYTGREGMKLAECNYAAIREIHIYK